MKAKRSKAYIAKAKHHDGVKSNHGGRKPKKRTNKENEQLTRKLMDVPL